MSNRVSQDQLDQLLDYLMLHPKLAKGVGLGVRSKETVEGQWDSLASKLNALGSGSSKTGDRWRRYWADLKHKVKTRAALRRKDQDDIGGGPPNPMGDLSETDQKVLAIIGTKAVFGDVQHRVPLFDYSREPESKKLRQDNFTIVKRCCVNLVKKHGRSVTLFDDLAFRELIDLIPMTQSEKQTLTSQYIQSLLDDDQLADETMDRTTEDLTADDDDDAPTQEIKGEIEPIPCTCGKDTDESMTRHNVECPASSQQTYWNFFEVSLHSATCQICSKTLAWTDITTLREHLQNSHPSVDFVDDDEDFQKGPPSEDGSTNDLEMEEVYLDETVLESEQTASAAKRRRKRATAPLNINGPIARENIATSLQRFKSLDSFGQYVASLMKLIPKDKCIKFQIQFVEQLLQEQAAAG